MTQRTATRVAWSAWVTLALVALLSFVFLWLSRNVSVPDDDAPFRGFEAVLGIITASAGLPIAARRPHHPIGWMFIALGASFVLPAAALQYAYLAILGPPAPLPGGETMAWAQEVAQLTFSAPIFAMVLLLFPTGRLVSRRWRYLLVLAIVSGPLEAFGGAVTPGVFRFANLENPYALTGAVESVASVVEAVGNVFFATAILGGVAALIVRFRRAQGDERQQLKWIAAAAALVGASMVAFIAIGQDDATSPWARWINSVLFTSITFVPVAASLAVLRYRLYDIDRIISRTVSYTIVTAVLLGVYATVVLVPMSLAGGGGAPEWLIAIGTLAAAALFRPVRRRIQHAVDRRFNRARFDADRVVETFARRLGQLIDPDTVGDELMSSVRQTLQPSHISLWLVRRP